MAGIPIEAKKKPKDLEDRNLITRNHTMNTEQKHGIF